MSKAISRHHPVLGRVLPAALAVLALGVLPAGAAQQPKKETPMETEVRLPKEVRHVLVTEPFYTVFDNLEFMVEGNHVTLMGQVVRPTLKIDAVRDVKSIEGVKSVTDKIEVLPLSPNDDRIRRREFRAIYSASGFEKYSIQAVPPIHIIVKNGHVTLTGVVLNQMDKDVANVRAKSVPGVFSVTDDLVVQTQLERKG
jgi:BON domain